MCVELPKLILTCAYGVIEISVSMSSLRVPTASHGCRQARARQARAMQASMN